MRYQMRSRLYLPLVFVLFHLLLLLLLRHALSDTKYSLFHRPDTGALREAGLVRLREAESYLTALKDARADAFSQQTRKVLAASPGAPPPDVCLVVVTGVARPQNYVVQSTAFLIARALSDLDPALDAEVRKRRKARTDGRGPPDPKNPTPFAGPVPRVRAWIQNSVGSTEHLGILNDLLEVRNSYPRIPAEQARESGDDWILKGVWDYAQALHEAVNAECALTLLLEDDGIVAEHFLPRLLSGLEPLLDGDHCDWAFVKIFATEFWEGWQINMKDIAILAGCGIVVGCAAVYAMARMGFTSPLAASPWKALRSSSPTLPHPASSSRFQTRLAEHLPTAAVFGYALLITILIMHAIGRQTLGAPWHRSPGLHPAGSGVSTVAHVYPTASHTASPYRSCAAQNGADLVQYLNSYAQSFAKPDDPVRVVPVDVLVDRFVASGWADMWELQPHLVQHIGAHSSTAGKNQGNFDVMKISTSFRGDTTHID
ncbi:hypothetical protein HDU89_004164 [Geranomyces variabilis]|nr:hypothetical protein HDU89_004164 [Geranomyces variabilis]